jgi:hypothetical protein
MADAVGLVDSNGENRIEWPECELTVVELVSCFPDSRGLVVVEAQSRRALRADSAGRLLLRPGCTYVVPVPRIAGGLTGGARDANASTEEDGSEQNAYRPELPRPRPFHADAENTSWSSGHESRPGSEASGRTRSQLVTVQQQMEDVQRQLADLQEDLISWKHTAGLLPTENNRFRTDEEFDDADAARQRVGVGGDSSVAFTRQKGDDIASVASEPAHLSSDSDAAMRPSRDSGKAFANTVEDDAVRPRRDEQHLFVTQPSDSLRAAKLPPTASPIYSVASSEDEDDHSFRESAWDRTARHPSLVTSLVPDDGGGENVPQQANRPSPSVMGGKLAAATARRDEELDLSFASREYLKRHGLVQHFS